MTALYPQFLSFMVVGHGCLCACTLWSMCVCVCSQLCWHFLKRGWHFQGIWRFDPVCVWRAVSCPPHNTEGNAAVVCPCLQAFGLQHLERPILIHPKYDQEKTCTTYRLTFRDDGFTAWSLTLSCCFPLSWGVFWLFSTEAEKLSLKETREESRERWCGREKSRTCDKERGRDPFLLLQAG